MADFDLQDSSTTRSVQDSAIARIPKDDSKDKELSKDDNTGPLDTTEARDLHEQLIACYRQELDRQAGNRFQMAVDEDYIDNIQWSEEDAQVVRDRGQAPLVYNVIASTVRWVTGTEKRSRMDWKVLPRRKNEGKQAEKKTQLLKYLSDVNRTPFHRSRAFANAVGVGIGWMECGVQDEDDGEMIYDRYESWRNVLWDSSSTEMDLSDARYLFRMRWVDVDVAKSYFPDRAAQIEAAAVEGDAFGAFENQDGDEASDFGEFDRDNHGISRGFNASKRRRVRLIEGWYRKPGRKQRIMDGPWKGQIYDPKEPRHQEFAESLAERMTFTMNVVIMTTADLLYAGPSPYRHNKFSLIPIWGYRRGRDGLPYGMVRGLRDIQDDINKRAAKAQYIMSTNKVEMDEGAVDDIEEFREEVARPDAIIVKRPGKSIRYLDEVKRTDTQFQMEMFSRGIQMIQQVGGVTDEAMGRSTNAVSGVAIQARADQGSINTMDFFDNLRLAEQQRGEIVLSLCEQYMTEQKQFRITNMRGNADFVELNTGLPEDDITRTKADFVISEQDWRATIRQANTEQLIAMMKTMPEQVALVLLDLVVEGMDIANRDEVVKRIRQISGQRDPDASEPTPEEQAAAADKQRRDMQVEEERQAQLRLTNSTAAKNEATAARTQTQAIGDRVNTQKGAMETAVIAVAGQGIAHVADGLLDEAGWPRAPAPVAPVQQAPQQMPQQMPPADMQQQGAVPPPAAADGINPPM